VSGPLVADLDAALDAYAVQRLTLRRAPRGPWVALAIGVRGVEAVGTGPDVAAAVADVLADLHRIDRSLAVAS
jgi:hypothetical protein